MPTQWAKDTGYERRWFAFIDSLDVSQTLHTITDQERLADVVIGSSRVNLNSSDLWGLLRPLSRADILNIVWDWGVSPSGRNSGFYCNLVSSLFDDRRHATLP